VRNDDLTVVQALLAAKADVNAETSDGTTALMMAEQSGSEAMAQLLRHAGTR
jgi:ankyrin repeat protein